MLFSGGDEEKRDFSRMGVACPATLRINGEGVIYHAMATDLSAVGLQLHCATALAEGTMVMVAMTPDPDLVAPLQATATVVRCIEQGEGYLLGMKIITMSPGL